MLDLILALKQPKFTEEDIRACEPIFGRIEEIATVARNKGILALLAEAEKEENLFFREALLSAPHAAPDQWRRLFRYHVALSPYKGSQLLCAILIIKGIEGIINGSNPRLIKEELKFISGVGIRVEDRGYDFDVEIAQTIPAWETNANALSEAVKNQAAMKDIIDEMERFAKISYGEGTDALDSLANEISDPFLKQAITLAVGSTSPHDLNKLKDILEYHVVLSGYKDEQLLRSLLIIEGAVCIAAGSNPRRIRDNLEFLMGVGIWNNTRENVSAETAAISEKYTLCTEYDKDKEYVRLNKSQAEAGFELLKAEIKDKSVKAKRDYSYEFNPESNYKPSFIQEALNTEENAELCSLRYSEQVRKTDIAGSVLEVDAAYCLLATEEGDENAKEMLEYYRQFWSDEHMEYIKSYSES